MASDRGFTPEGKGGGGGIHDEFETGMQHVGWLGMASDKAASHLKAGVALGEHPGYEAAPSPPQASSHSRGYILTLTSSSWHWRQPRALPLTPHAHNHPSTLTLF